jgi:hypothetical protein
MAELWRVIPEGIRADDGKIYPFTSKEVLDKAMHSWGAIALDASQPDIVRRAAKRLIRGRIQVAARIEWVDVDD